MDNTSGPIDLNALGFIGGPVPYATPGINQTYPAANPSPKIASVEATSSPGFFGSLVRTVEDYGSAAIETIEEAPSHVAGDLSNGYATIRSAVSTVGTDVGGGLNNMMAGIEGHVFLIFGVIVVGLGVLLYAGGKSGAVNIKSVGLV